MQHQSVFERRLKTSRRFVFENIMDVEHVCSLHRRWFNNLRLVTRRPEYVEYKLTSHFYGLRQETLARGGPVDENRYWYEFLTPLAAMRVEGLLEGPDGDLLQRETISYKYSFFLAPLFWLLRPLFERQKQDILRDDAELLERVYRLERSGFRRFEPAAPKIVVYGGNGFFGRLLVEDLLRYSQATVIVASRSGKQIEGLPFGPRVAYVQSDIQDSQSVRQTIAGAQVAIGCIGPFQQLPLNLLRACIEQKIHYVDVADDRDFVERACQLAAQIEDAGIIAFPGCSVVPGLSTLLTGYAAQTLDRIQGVRISITPGTRNPRGRGSFLCLFDTAGKEFLVPSAAGPRPLIGWSEPRQVEFPSPIGLRTVYSVVDIADYWAQPHYFDTQDVEFKIGSEVAALNRAFSALAGLRRALHIHRLEWAMPIARALVAAAAVLGTTRGALLVEVKGSLPDGRESEITYSIFAAKKGEIIPALLPSLAAQMILAGEIHRTGVVPHPGWIAIERLGEELRKRDISLAKRDDAGQWAVINHAPPTTIHPCAS